MLGCVGKEFEFVETDKSRQEVVGKVYFLES